MVVYADDIFLLKKKLLVRWMSGRSQLTANESYGNVPRVRIPPSPNSIKALYLPASGRAQFPDLSGFHFVTG